MQHTGLALIRYCIDTITGSSHPEQSKCVCVLIGMSVLQCASVALKATLHQLENSKSPNHTRIHELRKMQIMETLECLLQMGSYFHTMVCIP